VLAGIRRIQSWKERLGSALPNLDSFFVVMRSNFREIPRYLELMREHGITDVSLQTLEINQNNSERRPELERDEAIADPAEVAELHGILREAFAMERPRFRMIRASGLRSLFEPQGLDPAFLMEETTGLYPDSDGLTVGSVPFDLCPNPWTTLFVVENGDVHVCFLSEAIGNLHQSPLASLWNCPQAQAKRSQLIAGQYLASTCSERFCSWREGRRPAAPLASTRELRSEIKRLKKRAGGPWSTLRRFLRAIPGRRTAP
jgi:MoaA/NifB/PqqE/SkfB family radical SAM enzyme